MPRAFSDQERLTIQARLMEAGREYFERFGIRRTTVEDLTRSAGISKGAFYLFFDSKEELFMQILEAYEAEVRVQIFASVLDPGKTSRENFASLLRQSLVAWDENSLLHSFSQADLEYLRRKLPPARLQQHAQEDDAFVEQVLKRWQQADLPLRRDPRTVSGLMKALFFLALHRDDFGQDLYWPTMEVLIDLIAGYLVGTVIQADASPPNRAELGK